jgi:hypothetical protein
MFTPTNFYPAIIRNDGAPCLFTNKCDTATEAKKEVQNLIDNGSAGVGTKGHAIAGFAYFNEVGDIVYVFATKEDMQQSLNSVKSLAKTGSTRQYAKLKSLKASAVFALNFLNNKEAAIKVNKANTFKLLNEALAA